MQTELFEQEDEHTIWSVTGITHAIRKSLQSGFPVLWVRGEVSNLRVQASGHRYFLLKDENCQLKAVLFRGDASGAGYLPKDGDECLAYGEITVYEPRGEYQLRVRHLLQDGLGDLRMQFEKLKEKLLEEGIFDDERKKALPSFARTIAIITSPDGAAFHDFLSILKRRQWAGKVWLVPSLVQGREAPKQLINGIHQISKMPNVDLLVLARGGGSMEDLWSFNDEQLVRALAQCPIPTISAIGHQTDFVLTDFAADFRAETPSAAAEWISSRFLAQVDRLNQLQKSLLRNTVDYLASVSNKLSILETALSRFSPKSRMELYYQQIDDLEHRLKTCTRNYLDKFGHHLHSLEQQLHANSLPTALKRGFSYLSDEDGNLIRSIGNLNPGMRIRAHLTDGSRPLEVLPENSD